MSERITGSLPFSLEIRLDEARFLAGPLRLRFSIAQSEDRFDLNKTG